jgi:cytochrome c biogenesis protein CcmG/thiol:disulfide interchange protein DsbE
MQRRLKVALITLAGLPIIGLFAWGLTQDPHSVRSPLPGRPAPQFALETLEGDSLRMSELQGQVVVVNFWASWCLACIGEHPLLVRASQQFKNDPVRFVGVVYQDTRDNAQQWLNDRGVYGTSVLDKGSRTAIDFGLAGVPETFFIGKDGRVAYKQVGPVTDEVLRTWIPRLLSAPAPTSVSAANPAR